MPARKKKPVVDPAQADIEEAIDKVVAAATVDYSLIKPADLIAEYHTLDAFADEQQKKFGAYIKPTRDRIEEIRQLLHGKLLHEGVNGFPTDNGTAYLSHIMNHTIDPESSYTSKETGRVSYGRDALLDWALDNWDEYGGEGLQININKATVEKWMNDHVNDPEWNDKPVPGIKLNAFLRLNIKKS